MEIVKVYKERFPDVKLVGRRYTNRDRDETGTFAGYWQQCFREDWPAAFHQCAGIPCISGDLVGAMRMAGADGGFEYWIGAFCAPGAQPPEGFEAVEIPAGEVGIVWLRGSDKTGELYGMEASKTSMKALTDAGWAYDEAGWFFERYNCPRFTEPDENGNVILDICAYLV